jgi:hypothetical protein
MMKTSSWFDALALLVISLMSVAAAVATDATHADPARVLEAAATSH